MSAKTDEKKRSFNLTIPPVGYPRTMVFNRFCLEKTPPFLIAHFGYMSAQGALLDVFSFAVPEEDLAANRESTLQYLERLGGVADHTAEKWVPPQDKRKIEFIRAITTSQTGPFSEITVCTFAMGAIIRAKAESVQAQPIAILACETPLHKYVVSQLFIQ